MHVHEGDPLFELYSPELQVAAEELLGAVRAQRAAGANAGEAIRKESASLVDSARRKLRLWDVSNKEIDAIVAARKPPQTIMFRSPATGHLEEKMVVQGASVQPGMKLLRIADHTKLWLETQVYEEQVPLLALGQKLEATVDALPGETFAGPVTFIAPHIDPATRTIMVRATLENPDLDLKPGMFASARIIARRGDSTTVVPREAVIDTGTRQVAFVERGQGHYEPRLVRLGRTGDDDMVEVVDGLALGETVVTSGQFLMDVESRTVEAIQKLRAPTTRPAGTGSSLLVVYCGMEKADWLQAGDTVANPYSGSKMPDCGEVKRHIRNPKDDPQLAELVRAYLAEQAALASDKIDPKVSQTLKTAAVTIGGDRADSLREAIDKLSAATDLKDARAQFKTVSERLIRLLEEPGR
jgi:RND family efflux transporter MFP subunit